MDKSDSLKDTDVANLTGSNPCMPPRNTPILREYHLVKNE